MSTRTLLPNGSPRKLDQASNGSLPRSASSVQIAGYADGSLGTSTPNRALSRSSSTLNVSLEQDHQQIVYPHTISSVLNDPTVRIVLSHFLPIFLCF